MVKLLVLIKISTGQGQVTLYSFIYNHLLVPVAGNQNGSLLFPLLLILIWVLIMIPLYRKRIFIRI